MRKVLYLVEFFQTQGQKTVRYEKNPFVNGDNVAEHIARLVRLLLYIAPDLQREFPDESKLIQDIFACVVVHDDEEIIDGFDIPTAIKNHDADNDAEIRKFSGVVSVLSVDTQKFLIDAYSSFRHKSSLAAKIAKALDNIAGNQLVIEQKIGLINPDSARFCVDYVQKVIGVSKTIDALIDAQIDQVVGVRNQLKNNPDEISKVANSIGLSDTYKIEQLLAVDILTHVLDKDKVYTPIQNL